MDSFFKKNGSLISTFFLIAITFWLVFLILIPQLYMLDLSFRPNLPPLLRGGPDDVYTLTHYKHFVFGSETSKDTYNYVDIGVFVDTIGTAVLVTIINLCFCYPIAFYIAKLATPNATRLLILALIIPFWINELLRSFAIRILFAGEGVINNLLIELGLLDVAVNFIALDVALYNGKIIKSM